MYLPSGPVIPEHGAEEERLVAAMAAASRLTIARINYRFSPNHSWPTPLHDVLTGYDWINANLVSSQPSVARLGVFGELVGGSLATSLALTECRVGGSRIAAAAVNNPIADWVFPDDLPAAEPTQVREPRAAEETSFPADQDMMTWWAQQEEKDQSELPPKPQKRQKRGPKARQTAWQANADNQVIPTRTLSGEREILFPNRQRIFDRFASPIHFFRSPHGELLYPSDDDAFASLDPLDVETRMDISHYESSQSTSETPEEVPVLQRCRAYARIYPPANTALILPQWYITSGSQSPLLDQASELAKMLKRSIARQQLRSKTARSMWRDKDEKAKYDTWADQRVQLQTLGDVGLWTLSDNPAWDAQVEEVGRWMKDTLQGGK